MYPEIQLAIPSSLTIETADQKIKTYKVGQIARAAALFRVNRIAIYRDPAHDDSRFIAAILQYMEAPQYLRKLLFPRSNELRYIGVVPPLKTCLLYTSDAADEEDSVDLGGRRIIKKKKKKKKQRTKP